MVGRPRCSHRFSGLTMSQVMSAAAPPIRCKHSDFVAAAGASPPGGRLMNHTPLPRLEDQKPPQLLLPLASGSEGGILAAMLSPPSEDPLSDCIDLAVTMRRGPPPLLLLPPSPPTYPPPAVDTFTTNLLAGLSPTMPMPHPLSLISSPAAPSEGGSNPASPAPGYASFPPGSPQPVCTTPSGVYVPVNIAALSALAEFIDATTTVNVPNKCPDPPPLGVAAAAAAEGDGIAISEGRGALSERHVQLLTLDSLSELHQVLQQALAAPAATQTSHQDDACLHKLGSCDAAGSPSEGGLVWPQLPCLLGLPAVLPEEIHLHQCIGKGSYGEVFSGT